MTWFILEVWGLRLYQNKPFANIPIFNALALLYPVDRKEVCLLEQDFLKLLVSTSSFGLVAWLMLQTFSKTIPALSEQFRQDLQRERESSERGLREVAEALERLSVILIYHDATVRGKNAETLGSIEELLRVLRGKAVKGGGS